MVPPDLNEEEALLTPAQLDTALDVQEKADAVGAPVNLEALLGAGLTVYVNEDEMAVAEELDKEANEEAVEEATLATIPGATDLGTRVAIAVDDLEAFVVQEVISILDTYPDLLHPSVPVLATDEAEAHVQFDVELDDNGGGDNFQRRMWNKKVQNWEGVVMRVQTKDGRFSVGGEAGRLIVLGAGQETDEMVALVFGHVESRLKRMQNPLIIVYKGRQLCVKINGVLTADYKFAVSVINYTGQNSTHPCPFCEVSKENLMNLSHEQLCNMPIRTEVEQQRIGSLVEKHVKARQQGSPMAAAELKDDAALKAAMVEEGYIKPGEVLNYDRLTPFRKGLNGPPRDNIFFVLDQPEGLHMLLNGVSAMFKVYCGRQIIFSPERGGVAGGQLEKWLERNLGINVVITGLQGRDCARLARYYEAWLPLLEHWLPNYQVHYACQTFDRFSTQGGGLYVATQEKGLISMMLQAMHHIVAIQLPCIRVEMSKLEVSRRQQHCRACGELRAGHFCLAEGSKQQKDALVEQEAREKKASDLGAWIIPALVVEGVTITEELNLAAPPPALEAVEDNGDPMEIDDDEEEEEGEEAGEAQEEACSSNKAPRVARGPSKAALARAAKEEELKARIVELEKQLLDAITIKLGQSQNNRARLTVSQPGGHFLILKTKTKQSPSL